MPDSPPLYTPHPLLQRLLGPFAFRPRLMGSTLAGLAVFASLSLAFGALQPTLRVILSWNVACLIFVALVVRQMQRQGVSQLKAYAAQQDEGQGLIPVVVVLAAAISLVAVGLELSDAKADHGLVKGLRIAGTGATVALSWLTVQIVFALHYAHQYYAPDRTTPDEADVVGGLAFPGGEEPDHWDFFHFAVVIGVACQTADVEFTARRMRHIGTAHGIVAFVFNTVVLALTINMLAGLF